MISFPSSLSVALTRQQSSGVDGWTIDFSDGNNIDNLGRSATLTSASNNGTTGIVINTNGAIVSFPSAYEKIGQMENFTVYWYGKITSFQAAYSKLLTVPWDLSYSTPYTQFSLGRNNGTNAALFGFGNLGGLGFTDVATVATNFYVLDSSAHLYAVTRSGSTWSFYRDNSLIETQTASTQVIGYNNPTYLDAPINLCNNINTLVTETTQVNTMIKVGVLKKALRLEEIQNLYSSVS